MIRFILAGSALALTTACATTTELQPFDEAAFVAAVPLADEPDRPVEIVETAIALPLPLTTSIAPMVVRHSAGAVHHAPARISPPACAGARRRRLGGFARKPSCM